MIPRRAFLKLSLAGAAISLRPAQMEAGPARDSWRLHLSTSSVQFKDLPIEKVCARIAGLGYEAIDIWSAYDGCPHLDDIGPRLGGAGLKELLARHGLKLGSFSTYVGGYARYAELLGQAGGGLAIQGSTAAAKPGELSSRMRDFLHTLDPLLDLAEKHNSRLAIENHGDALLDSLDSFKAFVDLNRSPRLGIALAPYHLQALSASVEEAIGICGSQLFFFYAWQNQPGLGQLPGQGPTEFRPWLDALAAIRYPGYVNPFMHGHPGLEELSAALSKARHYLNARTP